MEKRKFVTVVRVETLVEISDTVTKTKQYDFARGRSETVEYIKRSTTRTPAALLSCGHWRKQDSGSTPDVSKLKRVMCFECDPGYEDSGTALTFDQVMSLLVKDKIINVYPATLRLEHSVRSTGLYHVELGMSSFYIRGKERPELTFNDSDTFSARLSEYSKTITVEDAQGFSFCISLADDAMTATVD